MDRTERNWRVQRTCNAADLLRQAAYEMCEVDEDFLADRAREDADHLLQEARKLATGGDPDFWEAWRPHFLDRQGF